MKQSEALKSRAFGSKLRRYATLFLLAETRAASHFFAKLQQCLPLERVNGFHFAMQRRNFVDGDGAGMRQQLWPA